MVKRLTHFRRRVTGSLLYNPFKSCTSCIHPEEVNQNDEGEGGGWFLCYFSQHHQYFVAEPSSG